jgi:hypothetical protein
MVVGGKAVADFANGLARSRLIKQAGQNRLRPGIVAARHQIAWAFRNEHQSDKINRRRCRLKPEHPAPRRLIGPQDRGGIARHLRQNVIDDKGPGQARNDHHLLHAGQAAAHIGGHDFGDIDRRNDAGRTPRPPMMRARMKTNEEPAAPRSRR